MARSLPGLLRSLVMPATARVKRWFALASHLPRDPSRSAVDSRFITRKNGSKRSASKTPNPSVHHHMAFSITYHPRTYAPPILPGIFQTSEPLTTEWITPEGWTTRDARRAFEARHPGCIVLRCDDIGNPYS